MTRTMMMLIAVAAGIVLDRILIQQKILPPVTL